jgi:hypothetical protein
MAAKKITIGKSTENLDLRGRAIDPIKAVFIEIDEITGQRARIWADPATARYWAECLLRFAREQSTVETVLGTEADRSHVTGY